MPQPAHQRVPWVHARRFSCLDLSLSQVGPALSAFGFACLHPKVPAHTRMHVPHGYAWGMRCSAHTTPYYDLNYVSLPTAFLCHPHATSSQSVDTATPHTAAVKTQAHPRSGHQKILERLQKRVWAIAIRRLRTAGHPLPCRAPDHGPAGAQCARRYRPCWPADR